MCSTVQCSVVQCSERDSAYPSKRDIKGTSLIQKLWQCIVGGLKLDGVGPVDDRPSTDKLHPFVRKKNEKKLHVTRDT